MVVSSFFEFPIGQTQVARQWYSHRTASIRTKRFKYRSPLIIWTWMTPSQCTMLSHPHDRKNQYTKFYSMRNAIWEKWKQLQSFRHCWLDGVPRSTTGGNDGNNQDDKMVVRNKLCKCDVSKSRFTLKYLLESLLLFCTTGSISFPCQNDNDKNYIMIMIQRTPVIADARGVKEICESPK